MMFVDCYLSGEVHHLEDESKRCEVCEGDCTINPVMICEILNNYLSGVRSEVAKNQTSIRHEGEKDTA